jgi:hypothetical protein
MQEKIYEFKITQPLTSERRKAIGVLIEENAHRIPWEITYSWSKDKTQLVVNSKLMRVHAVFHPTKIVVFRDAKLWARMLLTKKKQEQMQSGLVNVLKKLGFFETKKAAKSKGAAK